MDHIQPKISIMVVSALLAVLLQIILAPSIAIASTVPDFVLVTVVILALHNGPIRSTVLGFLLGLVSDLLSAGPLGAMTLVLTLVGYTVSSLYKSTSGVFVIGAVILVLATLLAEFLKSVLYAVVGSDSDFLLSLLLKVLPTTLYSVVIGLALLALYKLLTRDRSNNKRLGGRSPKMKTLRL